MENVKLIIPDWCVCEAVVKASQGGGRKPTKLELFIYDYEPANRTEAFEFRDGLAAVITENCGCKCDSGNGVEQQTIEQFELTLDAEPE